MSEFLTDLVMHDTGERDASGRVIYQLDRELVYEHGSGRHATVIAVPRGRRTNLATIPKYWCLQWWYRDMVTADGEFARAPVLHDFLCNEEYPNYTPVLSGFTRLEADNMLRTALESLGARRSKAFSVWLAVRLWANLKGISQTSQKTIGRAMLDEDDMLHLFLGGTVDVGGVEVAMHDIGWARLSGLLHSGETEFDTRLGEIKGVNRNAK